MIGCYSLDLYCKGTDADHGYGNMPQNFTGSTFAESRRSAIRRGWKLPRGRWDDGEVVCPVCCKKASDLAFFVATTLDKV